MGMLRQPVIRDPKCLQLRRAKMSDMNNGDLRHSKLSMADNDLALAISYHGHHEAKLPDGIRKLIDLTLGMLSRITRIQEGDLPPPDIQFECQSGQRWLLPSLSFFVSCFLDWPISKESVRQEVSASRVSTRLT
jgi:hypothetical protein